MRIKSDFHDYYDSAQSFGQDQSLIYIRKQVDSPLISELKQSEFPFPLPNIDHDRGFTRPGELPTGMRFYVVGVAGKVYPCFELVWRYAYPDREWNDYESFCYSLADIEKAIKTRCDKKAQDTFNEIILNKSKQKYRWHHCMLMQKAEFQDFFNKWEQEDRSIKVQILFERHPLWVIDSRLHLGFTHNWHICYNCRLQDYKFFKVKDTLTTYQEIAMFLGGLATPQKSIPIPSDRDMVSIKGFDKFSFRKDPSKKK